ncbi:phosphate ABC transporter permease subunit PstC [Halobacterium bonnevillei]|uniref:Phosphate transport system permease protein n=1 Tax=Halobacterium bonnevillei TaxID=2692200 RepID=A0A6B0SHJ2_9EURY|nr:phosphate ABC transporter permease subunit PstC [Halobacterium bonnevillei]MXR20016.1 phosphate ABC transporter permease subunit PstC [Halobacterium bonnevillei]
MTQILQQTRDAPSRLRAYAAGRLVATRQRARDYRSRTTDGAIAMHALVFASVVATFLLFLAGSEWTVLPVIAFVATFAVGWSRYQAEAAKALTFLTTVATVSILSLIIAFLLVRSEPIVRHMGLDVLTRIEQPLWTSNQGGVYALTPMMAGTAVTTVIATLVAAPIGIAGAVFVSEIAPRRVREVVKPGIELMAGIPSITYGFIGLTIVNQYFYVEFGTPTIGTYFAAGLMIGIMALPTVVTVSEDALNAVPESVKSGALAMGSTKWQTTKSVTIPAGLSGVSAGVLLGVGRALGETMAATVMLTHTKGFPSPVFDVFSNYGETLTTVIAFEGGNASGIHMSALFAGGVVLFVTVMLLSVTSQYVEWRMYQKLGGER